MTGSWLTLAMFMVGGLSACRPAVEEINLFAEGTCVLPEVVPCDDCLLLDLATRMGTEGERPGFLVDSWGVTDIVLDGQGRYWLGQEDHVKVYDSVGEFVTSLGRGGEGPMEFRSVHPFYVGPSGNIAVFDPLNARISLINPNFSLSREIVIPAFTRGMAGLTDDRYVFSAWMPTGEAAGHPIHLLAGEQVVSSFGTSHNDPNQEPLDPFTADRILATSMSEHVYAAHQAEYAVEAWTPDGTRVGRLSGPTLDDGQRGPPGPWSRDNPPWHGVRDIHVDQDDRVWVLLEYRKSDWLTGVVETIQPDGTVGLHLVDGPQRIYRFRIDVIDTKTCSVDASQWIDLTNVVASFVRGRDRVAVSELVYGRLGDPIVNIWEIALESLN